MAFDSAAPVILAYSGGLDTTWCIGHLREVSAAPIVAVTVDVGGFSDEEKARLSERCVQLGAAEHRWVDARDLFFDEVLRYLIYGNVLRGQLYPLSVGAERGLQAREVAQVAHELGASQIAHGCTAAGNDQIRFEIALRTLAPDLEILAPIRDRAPSRADEVADLVRWGFPPPPEAGLYSVNSGLWGATIGGVETLSSKGAIPESAWLRTKGALESGRAPERNTLGFSQGVPVSWNGEELSPVALIERVDAAAAQFGIGRGIHLGDTILGIKGRVAFEAPAATVLIQAHRELEKLTLTGEQQRLKDPLSQAYGELVHCGRALEPAARDLEAFFRSTQERVSGDVYLSFRVGSSFVEGVESEYSLMKASRAEYGEAIGEWTPNDAAGFGKLQALPGVLHRRAGQRSPESGVHA